MNIAEEFVAVAQRNGSRKAIIEARTGTEISFANLDKLSDRFGIYLAREGIGPRNIVMLMVRPSIEFIGLTLALFKIGATIVLIDPGMGYKNLLRCISRVEPEFLIGIPQALLFAKIFASHFRSVRRMFCCGSSWGIFGRDLRKAALEVEGSCDVYRPAKDDLAAIIFTTGSTGPPKGVCFEHAIFAAQRRLISEYYGISEGDVDQPAFPLFALFSTALGACAVIPDMDPTRPAQVDPQKFIASIKRYRVTYSFGSPALWNVVSRHCLNQGIQLETVTKVLMAGAPVPYELLARVRDILPRAATIHTPYGATESLPIVDIEAGEVLQQTWNMTKEGRGTCVGRPLPGISLAIIPLTESAISSLKQTSFLEAGQVGEIIVRGSVVTKSYHNNPQETAMAKIYEGQDVWHRMGDLGYLDHKGRLWFCGRKAHRVEAESGRLYSVCCEAIFNEHPAVYRSALVGIHKKNRCIPAIVIEPVGKKKGSTKKLLGELEKMAKAHPLTKEIDIFLIHKDFPVDIRHNAKIFREQLAQWAQKKICK